MILLKRKNTKTFTLLEVVLAIAILSMGLVVYLNTATMGIKMMNKAVKGWEVQHMLSQAAEFYLLAGPKEELPEEFFPFDGYQASCEIDIPELADSEEIETEFEGWQLVKLIITVTDSQGDEVGKIEMDKILKSEDVE